MYLSTSILTKTFNPEEVDPKLRKIIIDISNDSYYCYHCVEYRTTFVQLKELIEQQNTNDEIMKKVQYTRGFNNIINITNLIVVFYVYGGSVFAFSISLVSMILLFCTFCFSSQRSIFILDSFILILCILTLIKSFCLLENGKNQAESEDKEE